MSGKACFLVIVAGLFSCVGAVRAEEHRHHAHHASEDGLRAMDHAPIGVMGDHPHPKGEWMLSYSYMFMSMRGNRDGTERMSASDVLAGFPVTPTAMDMEMHMLGLMWAPTDRLTLMGMVPLLRLDMEHRTRMGTSFTTRAKGPGDVLLTGIFSLRETERTQLLLNLGISGPTGTLRTKDNTPASGGERVKLPYPMQLGSGTPDLRPALTLTGAFGRVSLGSRVDGTYRVGRNREGYRLGHRLGATGWAAFEISRWLSTSLRLSFDKWKDIVGDDGDLNGNMVPTADPSLRAGRRVDASLGLNFLVPRGPLRGNRFALEVARPIHQSLDGPQLETDWTATAGWQLAF